MKKTLFFLLSCSLLSACHKPTEMPLRILDGFDEVARENGEMLSVDSFWVVPLQSDKECLLKGVKKIVPIDSLVVVVSEYDVLAFDRQGRFVRRFGRQGHGEGEYYMVSTVYWDKEAETLHVIDGIRNRILIFALDGSLMSTKFLQPSTFSLLSTAEKIGKESLFCANFIYNDQNLVFSSFDIKKEESDSIFRFPGHTNNTQEYTGRHPFTVYDGKIICVLPFDNRIFVYSPETRAWQPWLEVKTDQTVLGNEQLSAIDDYGIFRYSEELSNGIFVGFSDVFVTEQQFFLGFSNLYYAIADKATGDMVKFNYGVKKDNVRYLPLLNILASDNEDCLIGYGEAMDLKSWHFADDIRDENLLKMKRTVSAMKKEDNPVLLFYKLMD